MLQVVKEKIFELSTKALAWSLLSVIALVGALIFFRPNQFEKPLPEVEEDKTEETEVLYIP